MPNGVSWSSECHQMCSGLEQDTKVILGVNVRVSSHNVLSLLEERKKKKNQVADIGLDMEYL